MAKNSSSISKLQIILEEITHNQDIRVTNVITPFLIENEILRSTFLVNYEGEINVEKLIRILNAENNIDYVEQVPNYEFFYTPNDLQPQQWNLQKIQAELAWDFTQGNSNVVLAMVDDAVLLSHQDLTSKIWINPGEIPLNGIDDDGNGYVDDVNGWDAADNDNNPNPFNPTNSSFTHGTHCAGISAAATNSGVGISSIGFNTTIMPVKIATSASQSLTGAFLGVQYAIANNADVISMSWGGGAFSQTYQALFDQAYIQGIVCIAAAGNSNTTIPMYPASYNHVISVGATDINDSRATFSNYGATIDVMAPGVGIYSSLAGSNSSYGNLSGTSMACPLVSGLAALMLSYDPSLSPDDLETCLKSSCDNIDTQNPSYIGMIGAGRVNAFNALQCLKVISADFSSDRQRVCQGGTIQFFDQSNNSPISWNWIFPGGTPATSIAQNPLVTYNTNGLYDVTLIATNSLGVDTITYTNYVTVAQPTALMSGNTSLLLGYSANISVTFTGVASWSFTYTDGTSNFTVNNVLSNPYYLTVSPLANTTYSLVSVNDANCVGTLSGQAVVTIVTGGVPCAQGAAITFQQVYGGAGDERAHSIEQTVDGGYIVAGETTSFGAGGKDIFVMKLDVNGIEQWTKTYGSTVTDDGNSITIKQTNDLGYIVSGHTEGFGAGSFYDSYILKLDNSGNIQWEKRITGSSWDMFRDVIELSNGDFLLTGSGFSFSAGNMDAHVVKISSTGTLVWIKNLGTISREHSQSILELPSSNYILSGNTNVTDIIGNTANAFLIKTDNNGGVLWGKEYGTIGPREDFNETRLLSDGNLLSVGETQSYGAGNYDIWLMKTDTNGNVIWSKTYGGTNDDIGVNVREKSNGELIISSFTGSYGNGNELLLINTDALGNVIWSKTYGGSNNDELEWWGKPMELTPNNEIILVGGTTSFGFGDENIYVVKTNECGESFCNEQIVTIAGAPASVSGTNFNVLSTSGGSLVTTNSTVNTISFTEYVLCDSNLVSVNDFSDKNESLNIYPNPASNYLNVENNQNLVVQKIEIFNITGKIIEVKTVEKTEKNLQIDISDLDNGVYFLKVYDNEEIIKTSKFLKLSD